MLPQLPILPSHPSLHACILLLLLPLVTVVLQFFLLVLHLLLMLLLVRWLLLAPPYQLPRVSNHAFPRNCCPRL